MKKTIQILVLLILYTPLCFAEQQEGAVSGGGLTPDEAWTQLAQPVHPHTRWETYTVPPRGYNYQPDRWSAPPVRPPWQNPYPPSRWHTEPNRVPAENPYPPSRWYTEPNQVPAENPYPPRRWLPPPRGPQWIPPPPSYQYWSPGYRSNEWEYVHPSQLSNEN